MLLSSFLTSVTLSPMALLPFTPSSYSMLTVAGLAVAAVFFAATTRTLSKALAAGTDIDRRLDEPANPMAGLDKLPTVFRHLSANRVFAEPTALSFDESSNTMFIDTGSDQLHVRVVSGDPRWLLSAHQLGGLKLRVCPAAGPDHLTVLAAWEEHSTTLLCQIP